ncbi:MAG: hypothetical protein WBG30_13075 [Psychrilyobacter sp.]|uniref:hypothetical protein n=1 Tax=Psychrilyobacter sp. TaxID=2586924 RepID=UPI003C752072
MKNKLERLSLEHFIKKAMEIESKREKLFLIDTGDFGEIEFKRPTTKEMLNYIDGTSNSVQTDSDGEVVSQDTEGILDASKELVYQCCSYMQSTELRESFDIENPLDTPVKIFGINKTNEIARKIMEKVNGNNSIKKATEEIKN